MPESHYYQPSVPDLKQQDHQAFHILVQEYHGTMLTVARSIVGDTWAEEVVQESWVSVYNAIPEFEGRSSLKTWLFTIVRNKAKSRLRKESRAVSLESSEATAGTDDLQSWFDEVFHGNDRWAQPPPHWDIDSPDGLLEEEQLRHCIDHTLTILSAEQRAVFQLRDLEQLPLDEICNILGLSSSNVRVLLHRARLKLMQVIDRYQETGEC